MDFDLDDELEMLQRELMAVQEEKTNPLSERTVAEIMVKLYHEGFSFYPTTDGNEYLTPEQLDKEIANLVRERGKINLSIRSVTQPSSRKSSTSVSTPSNRE